MAEEITLDNVDVAPLAPTTARNTVTETTQRKVIRMYLSVRRVTDIIDETGVPRSSLYWILQRNGIEPQRTGTRRGRATTAEVGELAEHLYGRIEELSSENERLARELDRANRIIERLTE